MMVFGRCENCVHPLMQSCRWEFIVWIQSVIVKDRIDLSSTTSKVHANQAKALKWLWFYLIRQWMLRGWEFRERCPQMPPQIHAFRLITTHTSYAGLFLKNLVRPKRLPEGESFYLRFWILGATDHLHIFRAYQYKSFTHIIHQINVILLWEENGQYGDQKKISWFCQCLIQSQNQSLE